MTAENHSLAILTRKLKASRLDLGLTQEAFAERANLSYKYYQSLESGARRHVRITTVDKLADALGVPTWELLHPEGHTVLARRLYRQQAQPPAQAAAEG